MPTAGTQSLLRAITGAPMPTVEREPDSITTPQLSDLKRRREAHGELGAPARRVVGKLPWPSTGYGPGRARMRLFDKTPWDLTTYGHPPAGGAG